MTTLTSLSSEVVDTILSYSDISFEDIINLRCVCKQFRGIAKTNKYCFYDKKFSQRWPSAKKYYDQQSKENSEQKQSKKKEQKDKKRLSFIETGIDCIRELQKYMLQMKINHDQSNFKLKMKFVLELVNIITYYNNYMKLVFWMDELKHLLIQSPRADCNLPERNYYLYLFDTLSLIWRDHIMEIFNNKSDKMLLEKSATILAQQLQLRKDVLYSSVEASLNNIALEARNFLRERHPEHLIFLMSDKVFFHLENNKIKNDIWQEEEGTQIMDTLEEYMFGKLNFRPTNSKELEYMCIDYVLENKCGNELILYIIYQSVARRLGLRCDVIYGLKAKRLGLFWIPTHAFAANDRNNINVLIKEHNEKVRYFNINFDKFPDCLNKNDCFEDTYLTSFAKMRLPMWWNEFMLCSISNLFPSTTILAVHDTFEDYVSKRRPKEVKFTIRMIATHGDESTDCSTGGDNRMAPK